MKKIVTLIAIVLCFTSKAQISPLWPSGAATKVSLSAGATNNITLSNNLNYVSSVPTLTANTTVSVTVGTGLRAGAHFMLTVKTTSTETTTFTGAIVAPVVTGGAGKTWSQGFIYNGTNFYPMGAKIQVD